MAVYSSKKDYSKSSKPQKTLKERMADIKARRAKSKAARAKKKAGKSWTKAVKKQKKKGEEGVTLSSLIAKRKDLTKGTAEYAAVQNKINKAYGSKVRHKATVASPKKEVSKGKGKTFGKEGLKKKAQEASKSRISTPDAKKQIAESERQAKNKAMSKDKWASMSDAEKSSWKDRQRGGAKKMAEGGRVESSGGGMFNWPSRDARNGGKG